MRQFTENSGEAIAGRVAMTDQKHIYRLVNRPPGLYLPEGYSINSFGIYYGNGSDGNYGTIAYTRRLTDKEKKENELLECADLDTVISLILKDEITVARLTPYVNDKRTTIYNESDNPFAHWIEDWMFRNRFYCSWRAVLVALKEILNQDLARFAELSFGQYFLQLTKYS